MEADTVEVFFSFLTKDRDFYRQIRQQLSQLERDGRIRCYSSEDVRAGEEVEYTVQQFLERATLIIPLVSPAYLATDDLYHELVKAMERQQAGKTSVVPILLRPGLNNYKDAPFADLKILPDNGIPITRWHNRSEALSEVATSLLRLVQQTFRKEPIRIVQNHIWTVPYPRNPFFTGREAELQAIETTLNERQSAAIAQAISGLGGIGKTQIALEYAYRHRDNYRYIFWILASTREMLTAAYSEIAELLDLPGKRQRRQRYIVEITKRWLAEHSDWLLILDNADDLIMVRDFLPNTIPGHILLTTRAHAMGRIAERIEIKKLGEEEGSRFLLRRSGVLEKYDEIGAAHPANLKIAQTLVHELDGLPLALDQAGAYMEETSCGLQGYLTLYRTQHAELLQERGGLVADHPEPVATTWSLAFERVEETDKAAADLLRLCAFLAADDIPELILIEGAPELTLPLQELAAKRIKFDKAIAALQAYSLVSRHPIAKTLDVHRLVQVVLQSAMTEEARIIWAKRTVRVLNRFFPWPNLANWEMCRQLLPHAQMCARLIEECQLDLIEGAHLLNRVGIYLTHRTEYKEAQIHLEKALAIYRKKLTHEHMNTAACLNNLAEVCRSQGEYENAKSLHMQALTIWQKLRGEEHPNTTTSLNNLALVYRAQGKYAEAEELHKRALAIRRKTLGEEHLNTAASLNDLALVYRVQGKLVEAEVLHKQALAIRRKVLGETHPDTASSLNNLANVYKSQHRYEGALPLFERARLIWQEKLDPNHPYIKTAQQNYEETLQRMREKEAEAEQNGLLLSSPATL